MSRTSDLAGEVLEACRAKGIKLATAESCTGGLVAAALTDIAGSSDVFDRGFVTYSNAAKIEMLGVPATTIAAEGAVSRETAMAMAAGALANSSARIAVSLTGVAGPGGGSPAKPVGLVWFGLATVGGVTVAEERRFEGMSRGEVRQESVEQALSMVLAAATSGATDQAGLP